MTRWERLIFYVADVDAFWAYVRAKNAISTCPIRTATSCRLLARSSDVENITQARWARSRRGPAPMTGRRSDGLLLRFGLKSGVIGIRQTAP